MQAMLPEIDRRVRTYGLSPQADLRAKDVRNDGLSLSFEVVGAEGSAR